MIEQATRKRMNIYITTSKNNLKYAYVSVKSLFINNQDAEIFLYVVSEDLTEADMRYERELADLYAGADRTDPEIYAAVASYYFDPDSCMR